jgi:hypothetical protein
MQTPANTLHAVTPYVRSDVWMFGVLAWELLCRLEPHSGFDIYEAAKRIKWERLCVCVCVSYASDCVRCVCT